MLFGIIMTDGAGRAGEGSFPPACSRSALDENFVGASGSKASTPSGPLTLSSLPIGALGGEQQ